MPVFHPDLAVGRFIPPFSFGPRLARMMRKGKPSIPPTPDDVVIEEVRVPATDASPAVSLRVYRPKASAKAGGRTADAAQAPAAATAPMPALFWIHGGGFIGGSPEQDERTSIAFVQELGITVVALRYRLSPDHAAPAALHDAYAGLRWLSDHAAEQGVDPGRIAVGGASAGAGLAAGLVLYAHDLGEVAPAFQLLVYPMLDDRTVTRTDLDTRHVRVWTPGSNRFAWTSYLGREPGGDGVSPYAAPARREDLSGLPPAWIGVGTLDLFHDEDVRYAERLTEAGVPCELFLVEGAFHGFDALFTKAGVTDEFWREQARALRAGLAIS